MRLSKPQIPIAIAIGLLVTGVSLQLWASVVLGGTGLGTYRSFRCDRCGSKKDVRSGTYVSSHWFHLPTTVPKGVPPTDCSHRWMISGGGIACGVVPMGYRMSLLSSRVLLALSVIATILAAAKWITISRTSGSSVFLTRGTPPAGQESRRGSESAEP